jgi:hypothetical protein
MTPKVNKTDDTRNQRQARRREREKQWLYKNGWRSWESMHTALMNGSARLLSGVTVAPCILYDQPISDTTDH